MIKLSALLLLAFCPLLVVAQNTKIIRLRYAEPQAVRDLIVGNGAIIRANNGLRAIVIQGNAEQIAAAEQAIKELDTPSANTSNRDIELAVYVIGATNKSSSTSSIPQQMQPVVKQLQSIFPYTNYELVDTMLLRSREGGMAETDGVLKNFPVSQNPHPIHYAIGYKKSAYMAMGTSASIHLDEFRFQTGQPVSFTTELDLREGQKVVVGKTNIDSGESALFVVVSAKAVE